MKQMLIFLLFLTGVVALVPVIHHKYRLIQQNKTWSDAQTYCRSFYINLATIESDADVVKLRTEAQIHQFNSDAWFGVYKILHDWRWSYGNETLGTLKNWAPNEPNNGNNNEECTVIRPNGLWYDTSCANKFYLLCYDERNSGSSRYIYISTFKTFFEAQSYCRLYHTDLASARYSSENSILAGLVSDVTWIGLFRTSWKWVDQTNLANITWKPGQPDNAQAYEDCGYLSNFQAADARCSDLKPFFCQGVPVVNQIVRFKIQSNQDVNNLTVKAALLEMILQKLEEHGLELNITLRWREQPSGEVFHKMRDDEDAVDLAQGPCHLPNLF